MSDDCAVAPADGERRFRTQMFHLSFHMRIAECTGCTALCKAFYTNQLLCFNWLYDVASAIRRRRRMAPCPKWSGRSACFSAKRNCVEGEGGRAARPGLEALCQIFLDVNY